MNRAHSSALTSRFATEGAIEKLALQIPVAEMRARMEQAEAARGAAPKVMPTLQEAVSGNLDRLERKGELRRATLYHYRSTQRRWVTPELGALPVDQVTPRLVGQIIAKAKEAGRSNAVIDGVRHPIRAAYERLIADEVLPASFANAGTDLSGGSARNARRSRSVTSTGSHPRWVFRCSSGAPRVALCQGGAIGLKANTGARTQALP